MKLFKVITKFPDKDSAAGTSLTLLTGPGLLIVLILVPQLLLFVLNPIPLNSLLENVHL